MAVVPAFGTTTRVPLSIRVERAALAEAERGLRIQAFSSVFRGDSGREGQADIMNLADAESGGDDSDEAHTVTLLFPTSQGEGTEANPWPADAYVWFCADIFAPSAAGPLVGGRGGAAAISLRDLRDRVVVGGSDVALQLLMTQSGLENPVRKMNLRILSVERTAAETVRRWVFAKTIEQEDFVPALLSHHDQMLENYVRKLMFPYTDEALSRGLYFPPSTSQITSLHAPVWRANIPVPQWAFWMQIGDRIEGEQMDQLTLSLRTAFDIVLARHDWKGGLASFVSVVLDQTTTLDSDEYEPRYTFACAVLCDACALYATQLYYRYDEAYEIIEYWFKSDKTTRKSIESFHDALSMKGGDCEDLSSVIHRIFRWIQLGDERLTPARIGLSNFHQAYGGWEDQALDALQRMAYWYVSAGCVGSVTSSRVPPGAGGQKSKLIINSELDESMTIGGHMWNVMLPVVKMEDLLQRMNPTTIRRGDLRPKYPGAQYPGWVRFLPMLTGEGTGALHPLIMPWHTYMHTDEGRSLATSEHEKRLEALRLIQTETQVMRVQQVQRVSDRVEAEDDRRANDFYRRGTALYTDDMALQGIPHFGCVWTRKAPRRPEASTRIAAIPGERGPGNSPTWGVNVRDAIFAANGGAYGDGKPDVALSLQPAVTNGEMLSFKSRIRQLKPWTVPVITTADREKIETSIGKSIPLFQRELDAVVPPGATDEKLAQATRINVIFRRNEFAEPRRRRGVLQDVRRLSGRIIKTTTVLEYPFDDGYSVCLSVWILSEEDGGESAFEEVRTRLF